MKHLLLTPKFLIDRIQIIFALVLVCIVFLLVYLTFVQPGTPQSPNTTPTHTQTQTPTQAVVQISPSGQTEQSGPIIIQPSTAVSLVESLQEIQDAKSISVANNTHFVTEIDSSPTSQNYYYVVHAYEVVSDGNGHTHTATVGWYRVNPQTGKVTNVTDQ